VLHAIAEEASRKVRLFKPNELSNILWAFAVLRHRPCDATMHDFAALASRQRGRLGAQNVANVLWAFASLRFHPGDEVMSELADVAAGMARDAHLLTPQGLANIMWGFASLPFVPTHTVLEDIAEESCRQIKRFNGQDLANTAWAWAALGAPRPVRLLRALEEEARVKVGRLTPQGLSTLASSFAKLARSIELVHEEQEQGKNSGDGGNGDGGGEDDDGYAYAGDGGEWGRHPPSRRPHARPYVVSLDTLEALAEEAARTLGAFSAQALSTMTWSFAALRFHPGGEFLGRVVEEMCAISRDFNPQNLANVVGALAVFDHTPGERELIAFAKEARRKLRLFNPKDLSTVAWALAVFGVHMHMPDHATRQQQQQQQQQQHMHEQQQHREPTESSTFAVVTEFLIELWERVEDLRIGEDFDETGWRRLRDSLQVWAFESPGTTPPIGAELQQRLAEEGGGGALGGESGRDRTGREATNWVPSALHRSVSCVLESMGVVHVNGGDAGNVDIAVYAPTTSATQGGARGGSGGFGGVVRERNEVDTSLTAAAKQFAVEVDGPGHFTRNEPFRMLGSSALKTRLTRSRGWPRVAHVPFYEWDSLKADADRAEYLRDICMAKD